MKNGTLLEWSSWGTPFYGFVIGTCSYDNCGESNGYVVRLVSKEKHFTFRISFAILSSVAPIFVEEWPEDFYVASGNRQTPEDRCNEWKVEKDEETGHLLILPLK